LRFRFLVGGFALGIATMGYVVGDVFWPTVIVVTTVVWLGATRRAPKRRRRRGRDRA
jgi:hypothetical protein